MRNAFLMAGFVVALTACSDAATQPDLAGPLFARPGSGRPPNTSAIFTLAGGNPLNDAVGNDYADGTCGVTATIFYNNDGNDGILNTNTTRCGGRSFTLTYTKNEAPVIQSGNNIGVKDMGSVADGTTAAVRQFGFGLTGTGCARIQFPAVPGNTVTRSGTTTGSVFTVNGSGTVRCLDSKGNVVAGSYTATVSFTVTQGNPK